jgi:tRNA U34 2-thiouridine synthase MnmA/TrmU
VDSAVTALLLQQQGYELFGVYMHNWDAADEAGAGTPACTSDADMEDAQALCKALEIPLYEADFVSRYWNEVFETFLQGLSRGLTPNPDLACNSHIKFGALLDFAREKGADVLATGHYTRLGWTPVTATAAAATAAGAAGAAARAEATGHKLSKPGAAADSSSRLAGVASAGAAGAAPAWQPVLLTGSDPTKDQSYFLASLTAQQLAHAMFPVGGCTCVIFLR